MSTALVHYSRGPRFIGYVIEIERALDVFDLKRYCITMIEWEMAVQHAMFPLYGKGIMDFLKETEHGRT